MNIEINNDDIEKIILRMTRFNMFADDELDAMESAFCNEGLRHLVDEICRERRYRESIKRG